MICRAHPPESRRFQHLDEQRGWALLRSYPRNPSPPPRQPPSTNTPYRLCLHFLYGQHLYCIPNYPPSPHPLKLCRTPPPTSAWWNLHTNMVWQPNYMLILHTWYILAGKKQPPLEKWLCKSTFLPDVQTFLMSRFFWCSTLRCWLPHWLSLLVYARLDAGDALLRQQTHRDRWAFERQVVFNSGVGPGPIFVSLAVSLLSCCWYETVNKNGVF